MILNGYTIWGSKPSSSYAGIVNYFVKGSSVNLGLSVPTMLRVKGTFSASEMISGSTLAAIFVDGMVNRFFAASPDESQSGGCNDGMTCIWYDSPA